MDKRKRVKERIDNSLKLAPMKDTLKKKFTKQRMGEQVHDESLQEFLTLVIDPLKKAVVVAKPQAAVKTPYAVESTDEDTDEERVQSKSWSPLKELTSTPIYPQEEVERQHDLSPITFPSVSSSPIIVEERFVGTKTKGPTVKIPAESASVMATKSQLRRRISTPPEPRPPSPGLRVLRTLLGGQDLSANAEYYLHKFFKFPQENDTNYGLTYNPDVARVEIGGKPIEILGNDIIIEGKQYPATNKLWSLLIYKDLKADPSLYGPEVRAHYGDILKRTGALYQNNDPRSGKLKTSNRGLKYQAIIKEVWEDVKKEKKGSGITKTYVHPSTVDYKYYTDPNKLVDRLRLLYRSSLAGDDAHANEMIEILCELEERQVISKKERQTIYRNLFEKK